MDGGQSFRRGYSKFWVYDPGYDTALGRVDARVGIYGSRGANNIGYMATTQIQDATTRDPNYWYAQWSFSIAKLDGVTAIAGGSGYTFTQGVAAPRVWGAWSYVIMGWHFSYTNNSDPSAGGTGTIKWYINQSSVTPNLAMNFDSTTSRWTSFHDVAGLFMGSGVTTTANGRPAAYDNFEFHVIPEPSSLQALGGGMLGLLGLIRKRK